MSKRFVDSDAGHAAIDAFEQVLSAWNGRDLSRLRQIYAPVIEQETGAKSVEAEIAEARAFIAAIPDLEFTIVRAVGVSGTAFIEWQLTGHPVALQSGEGAKAAIRARGSSLLHLQGDRIVAIDSWFDEQALSKATGDDLSPEALAQLRSIQ